MIYTNKNIALPFPKYFFTIMILSLCLNNIRININGILIKTWLLPITGIDHINDAIYWQKHDHLALPFPKYFVTIMILSLCLNNIRKNSNGILIKTWSLRITGIHHINDEINSMKTWSLALNNITIDVNGLLKKHDRFPLPFSYFKKYHKNMIISGI